MKNCTVYHQKSGESGKRTRTVVQKSGDNLHSRQKKKKGKKKKNSCNVVACLTLKEIHTHTLTHTHTPRQPRVGNNDVLTACAPAPQKQAEDEKESPRRSPYPQATSRLSGGGSCSRKSQLPSDSHTPAATKAEDRLMLGNPWPHC